MTVDEAFGFVDAEEWKRIPFEPRVLPFAHQVDDKYGMTDVVERVNDDVIGKRQFKPQRERNWGDEKT